MRIVALLAVMITSLAQAGEVSSYFVNIKAQEAHVRLGSSLNHGIVRKYIKNNIPVEVIAENNHWRKIKDIDGSTGWIHKALLNKKRTAFIVGETTEITNNGEVVSRIEAGVNVRLVSCSKLSCRISLIGQDKPIGYISKNSLWGVYPDETF